jgi:hypothetical protein
MSSNPRSIFKEVGNKSVGWAQQNTKAKSSIARNNNDQYIGSQQFVENDFDVVWMSADRMHVIFVC